MLKLVDNLECEYKEIKQTVIKNTVPYFFANILNNKFGFFTKYCVKMKYMNSLYIQYKILEEDKQEKMASRIREIMAHKMSINDYSFNHGKLFYTFNIEGQEYIMTIAEMEYHKMFDLAEKKTQKTRMFKNNNVINFPVQIQKTA